MREIFPIPKVGDKVSFNKYLPIAEVIVERRNGDDDIRVVIEVLSEGEQLLVAFKNGTTEEFSVFHPVEYRVVDVLHSDSRGCWYTLVAGAGKREKLHCGVALPLGSVLQSTPGNCGFILVRLGDRSRKIRFRSGIFERANWQDEYELLLGERYHMTEAVVGQRLFW